MKHTSIVLYVIFLLASCKGEMKQNDANNEASAVSTDTTQQLIEQFKPIIHGVWVKKDYIDKIINKRSPYEAFDAVWGYTELNIDTKNIEADSLIIGISLNNHEGGSVVMRFHRGKSKNSIQFDKGGELSYRVGEKDTILIVTTINEDTHKPEAVEYTRVLRDVTSSDDQATGIAAIINQRLIVGNYQLTDTLNKKGNVVFKADGSVTGIPRAQTFYILDDFMAGPMNDLDQLLLKSEKEEQWYAFKFNADTLNLYNTRANDDSTKLIIDKRVYKLVKVK